MGGGGRGGMGGGVVYRESDVNVIVDIYMPTCFKKCNTDCTLNKNCKWAGGHWHK